MKPPSNGDGIRYQVEASGTVIQEIKELVDRATVLGIADEVLRSLRQSHRRLQQEPFAVDEPVYRLHTLQLQVRLVVQQPLSVTFAVHEERPLVFIKVVNLLSGSAE